MTGKWREIPLSELTVTPVTYGVVQPGQQTPDGVPMVRVNNFQGHFLDLTEVMRIAPEIEAKYERTRIQAGDVLITIVGSVGQVAIVPCELSGWNIARAVAMIRPKVPELSRWISFALRSPQAQHQLGVAANTTVQTTINLKDLRELKIPLPTEDERYAIAHILGSLDDRIDNLRQTNATLEAIAQALFKSWFVDFDGISPEDMQASELGLIPKGWRVAAVGEYFDLTMGQSPPGNTYNEIGVGIPFYQGCTDFGWRFPTERVYCTDPTRLAKKGDVMVSVRAPVGDINVALTDCAIGRGVAAVHHEYASFALHVLCSLQFALKKFESEGTVFGSINKKQFEALKFVAPLDNVIHEFQAIVQPMDAQIENNELYARTLATLRDTLLPRLLSGQLRVGNTMYSSENSQRNFA